MPIKFQKRLEEAEKQVRQANTEEEKKVAQNKLEAVKVYINAMTFNKDEMDYLA